VAKKGLERYILLI